MPHGKSTPATLREHRIKAGLSVHELAKAAGLDRGTIHRLERGRHNDPQMSTVRKLATALEIEPADLVFGTSEQVVA